VTANSDFLTSTQQYLIASSSIRAVIWHRRQLSVTVTACSDSPSDRPVQHGKGQQALLRAFSRHSRHRLHFFKSQQDRVLIMRLQNGKPNVVVTPQPNVVRASRLATNS
jgi:hypothetical protein